MKNSKFLQLESNIWSWFKIFTKQNHLWYHTKLIINDSLTVLWGKWHFAGAGFQEDNLLVQALQLLPHAQNQSFSSFIKLNKINCGLLVTTLPEMGFSMKVKKQDLKSNGYDSILQWSWMEIGLEITYSLTDSHTTNRIWRCYLI